MQPAKAPPSRRRRRLEAAAALISNPLYLPNDGNVLDQTGLKSYARPGMGPRLSSAFASLLKSQTLKDTYLHNAQ